MFLESFNEFFGFGKPLMKRVLVADGHGGADAQLLEGDCVLWQRSEDVEIAVFDNLYRRNTAFRQNSQCGLEKNKNRSRIETEVNTQRSVSRSSESITLPITSSWKLNGLYAGHCSRYFSQKSPV